MYTTCTTEVSKSSLENEKTKKLQGMPNKHSETRILCSSQAPSPFCGDPLLAFLTFFFFPFSFGHGVWLFSAIPKFDLIFSSFFFCLGQRKKCFKFLWKLTLTVFVFYPVDCSLSPVSCKRVAETSLSKLHLRRPSPTEDRGRSNATAICVRIAPMKACGCKGVASTGNWSHHPATSRIRDGSLLGFLSGVPPPLRPCPRHPSLRPSAS